METEHGSVKHRGKHRALLQHGPPRRTPLLCSGAPHPPPPDPPLPGQPHHGRGSRGGEQSRRTQRGTQSAPPPPASRSGLKGGLQKPTGRGEPRSASMSLSQGSRSSPSLVQVPAKGKKVFRSETPAFLLPFEGKMYTQGICHLLHRRAPDQGHLLNWFNPNVILVVTHPSPTIFTRSIRN